MASNSEQVISLTSSDEEVEENSGPPLKRKKTAVDIVPQVSLTLVKNNKKRENVISLDSDDEDPQNNKNSNSKEECNEDEENGEAKNAKNKVKNPVNAILRKNGISVHQNADVVSVIIDSDSDTQTNEEEKERNTCEEVPEETNNKNEANKNNIEEADVSMESTQSDEPIEMRNNCESIIIDDSDEDQEKENHCENDIEPFPVNIDKTRASDIPGPSVPTKDEASLQAKILFKEFLKIVEEKIVDSSFEEVLPKKVPIIEKYFKKCGPYVNDDVFETILRESIGNIRTSPNSNAANAAVLAFHKVFEHLKSHVAQTTIEIEEDHLPKVKKLEKTLKLLRKRIKQLEEAEVNFDDEEDSAYIMLDRYQARLKKVYAKYCEYIRRNPHSGRAIYDKISFVNSKYNAINQAISRKYKNSVNFPSYYDLEKFIEAVVKKEKLNLTDQEIKNECKKCFKYLGSILQKKRRQELYDSHLDFIESTEDPASKDISLENVLRKNFAEGKEKIDKLYQKYVQKQEQGEDHVSSDEAESSAEENAHQKNDKGKNIKNGGKSFKKKSKSKTEEENKEDNFTSDKEEQKTDSSNENMIKAENCITDDNKSAAENFITDDKAVSNLNEEEDDVKT